ncbi:MAG: M48 family metallopeptidase [Blastochloris sp.]|jgi:predicted Zn-dependent protease|nr:M48 family metallopeptidase [Blastochloris sp.]
MKKQASSTKILWVIWTTVFLTLAACVQLKESGRSVFLITSEAQEASMGAQSFQQLKQGTKASSDPVANAQVQRVAQKLIAQVNVPHAQWEVIVFDDPTPNAFALPGGKIGVHTGILALTQSDAGLAAVLGHELAHVTLRHGGQRFSQQFGLMLGYSAVSVALANEEYKTQQLASTAFGVGSQVFLTLPFSRSNEYEADRYGLTYMARAGYDPAEAVNFWQRMKAASESSGGKPPEWMSTHPADENRIKQLQDLLPQAQAEYQRNRI